MIRLLGDVDIAGQYIAWVKARLLSLKRELSLSHTNIGRRYARTDDAFIMVDTCNGWDYIEIYGISAGAMIVSNPGTSTTDFTNRRYYTLDGTDMNVPTGKTPSGWQLLDDGQYGFIGSVSNDDPETNTYLYPSTDKGSLLVPHVFNGIAAVQKLGSKNYRYILNDTPEDEMFQAFTWTVQSLGATYSYGFCQLDDSLIYAPYKYKGNKPFISRYTQDGIITATQMWNGIATVLVLNSYQSAEWNDNVPIVTRIYFKPFNPTSQNVRRYAQVTVDSVCLAMTNSYKNQVHTQDVIRVNNFIGSLIFPSGTNMLEPARKEKYDIDHNTEITGTELDRGTDNVNYMSYFLDGGLISGQTFVFPTLTNDGLSTIQNDVIRPYSILEDGSMTYVRLQKDTEMSQWNAGLYVAGKLIEQSGFLPVIRLFDTTIPPVMPPAIGPYLGVGGDGPPIFIRPVNYRILHAHHESGWDVCVYRKTVYQSYVNTLLPNWIPRTDNGHSGDSQIWKVQVNSITTFYIVVNGKIYPLKYKSTNHEKQLVVDNVQYSGAGADKVTGGYIQQLPWVDIDEGSSNLTRIFTSASQKHILIGFDVFNVGINHIFSLNNHGGDTTLEAVYDPSLRPFPPASDGVYPFTQDRQWILFTPDGSFASSVSTPKFDSGGGIMKNVQRINSLCLLEE